jgi:Zn-dependent protease with chaperone function
MATPKAVAPIIAAIALWCGSVGAADANPAQSDPVARLAGAASSASLRVPVPPPSATAMQFYRSGNILWGVRVFWVMLVPAAFVFSGASARLRDFVLRRTQRRAVMVALFFILFATLLFLINLPLRFYLGFIRLHAYGLSNQSGSRWLADSLKEFSVNLAVGVVLVSVLYFFLRRCGRYWWIWVWLTAAPLMLLGVLFQPILYDPLFNDFGPMKNRVLAKKIISLAERAGIHESRVFEVDKSLDTKTLNAYVTGAFGSKRIVLWDTVIVRLDEDELLAVVAHEIGHYVLGHVWKGCACFLVLLAVGLWALSRLAPNLMARFKTRLGFDNLADVASLPLLLLLAHLLSLVLTPVGNIYSRHVEHEADRFALELTHLNRAGATGSVKLLRDNLAVPNPGSFYRIFRSTHPASGERIEFFNDYRPWETGAPLRYRKYFVPPQNP